MKYLKVFTDFVADMNELGDAERGRLFTAMLIYAETGEEPVLRGNERFVWGTAKKNIDNQREKYDHQCAVNKQVATNRYESLRTVTKENESLQDKDKEKEKIKEILPKGSTKKVFVAPTVEEVEARCREMGYKRTSPIAFVSHYESVGWKVGKNPMKDWHAALAGWEAREQQFRSVARDEPKRKKNAALNYEQTPISKTEFDKMIVDLS